MGIRIFSVMLCFSLGLCYGSSTCTRDIPHGEIIGWCRANERCPFSCDEGYQRHGTVFWVRCNSAEKWVGEWYSSEVTEDKLCKPKSCPSTIPNGKLSSDCSATVGTSCGYVCNSGFQSKDRIDAIVCQTSTNWSVDPHSLCSNNNQCPYELSNGDLELSCRRSRGETCNYACHIGYLPSNKTEPTTVMCRSTLSWSQPLSSLCQKIKCPRTITNGYITSRCTREFKSYCSDYKCDAGYQKPHRGHSLRCNASGEWDMETADAKNFCSSNSSSSFTENSTTLGVIIGASASFLMLIIVSVACWIYKKHKSQAPPTTQTAEDRIRHPVTCPKPVNQRRRTGMTLGGVNRQHAPYAVTNAGQRTETDNLHHFYIDVVDSPNIHIVEAHPVAIYHRPRAQTRPVSHSAPHQGSFNDYSVLRSTSRTETVINDVGREYARVSDISAETPEHGYSTVLDSRPVSPTPPPYYSSLDHPQYPLPTYEESQTVATIEPPTYEESQTLAT